MEGMVNSQNRIVTNSWTCDYLYETAFVIVIYQCFIFVLVVEQVFKKRLCYHL